MVFILLVAATSSVADVVTVADTGALGQAVRATKAGDTVEILPGDYLLSHIKVTADGREAAPIIVRAAIPGTARLWSTCETDCPETQFAQVTNNLLSGTIWQPDAERPPVGHDFCGQLRWPPSDLGAIEYKAGNCRLADEIDRRHGYLLSSLMHTETEPPPDWQTHSNLPPLAVKVPNPLRVLHANPDNLGKMLSQLRPGDRLLLAPGQYTRQLTLHHRHGTAEQPMVISGPETGEPAVFLGRRGANTVSLLDSSYLVIRHLTLDGQGLNIAGVVAEGHGNYAHDIRVEHLRIHNYRDSQANSGITTRVPAWNWVIRNNQIRDVGTGMYLGHPNGYGPFVGGLIENNFIADTLGYNIQIKQQNVRNRLPGMPTEPLQTIIRYNVFSKASGGASDKQARPNLLIGHAPPSGPGQYDRYLVYGNLFYQNPHERLLQGEGHLALYNNLFVNREGDAVIVMRHNNVPKNIQILNNTVVAGGFGIAVVQPHPDYRQLVAGNAIFAPEPLRLPRRIDGRGNFTASRQAAKELLANPEAPLARLDLFPVGKALHDSEPLPLEGVPNGLLDLDLDYTGRPRQSLVWGAYGSEDRANSRRLLGIGPNVPDCAPCE